MISRRALFKVLWVLCCIWLTSLSVAPSAIALGGTQPPIDQPAPEFTLPSSDGKVSLSDYRGKWVVVYFYPKDFTPGCTLEAQRFQKDLPKYLDRNTQILGISTDDTDSHAEFCDSEGLKFPLLADVEGKVSKAYGSWMGYSSLRHTYLVDPDGILRERFLGVRPAIHSTEVLAKLDELQATGAVSSAL
ncbi:peroxiredoxin [Phormidium tenue FACHB-886]|nr:peroxiredoxin [Phormidium tenue FACHB-886]